MVHRAKHCACGALALLARQITVSGQSITVLADGQPVAGITTLPTGGASIFLQKGTGLIYCFAAETPTSSTVATEYCKAVKP